VWGANYSANTPHRNVSEVLTHLSEPSRKAWVRSNAICADAQTPLIDSRPMSRFARRPKVHPRSRHSARQTVLAIAAFLSPGLLAGGEYVTVKPRAPTVAVAPSDDDIYTGSILYMPYDGSICRQLLFDNHTGRLSDNGNVDCEGAAYRSASDKLSSLSRAQVISNGFRDR
jgi:hypothetical protein